MVADQFAVEPYLAVFLDPVEFDKHLSACLVFIDGKMLSVPAPAVPPVRIVLLRSVVDEWVNFASGLVGLPGVGQGDCRPGGIVEVRGLAAFAVGIFSREIIE